MIINVNALSHNNLGKSTFSNPDAKICAQTFVDAWLTSDSLFQSACTYWALCSEQGT